MTDVVAAFGGWGRSTWGSGSWNNDNFETKATGNVGSVTVALAPDVSVTGLAGTGNVGSVTINTETSVSVTGLAATGAVGS